ASLLLAALSNAKRSADSAACKSNLRQLPILIACIGVYSPLTRHHPTTLLIVGGNDRAKPASNVYVVGMPECEFEHVVGEGSALEEYLTHLGLVAVGGLEAALHCRYRVSMDVDEVTTALREKYEQVLARLEDWVTNRRNPPVLILGQRHGIELGVRQQRRI